MSDTMTTIPGDSLAVRMTGLFLRFSGFWAEETQLGRRIMDAVVLYTIGALTIAATITSIDLYHCYGDFGKFVYGALPFSIVITGFCKVVILSTQRKYYLSVIIFTKNNFWQWNYDEYSDRIMKKCMKRSCIIIMLIVLTCHSTLIPYIVIPLLENQGKNESDRILPFKIWLDLPVTMTPWYEILFATEMFSAYHCCVCYFCFDNFLSLINITLVGQFMILQEEIRNICKQCNGAAVKNENNFRVKLTNCIIKHQQLINFTDDMKELHKLLILEMVVVLSITIGLELYQLMMSTADTLTRLHGTLFAVSGIFELYFFMLSCNELSEASYEVADAAYDVQWFFIESESLKRNLVNDLMTIIMRSQKPCSLTVGGFSSVTLQTFTSICNRAFSFLTLMRQSTSTI